VFKMLIAFLGVAVLALGGAVVLLVWISSMTPIHATEELEVSDTPPDASEWINRGAVLLAVGEVDAVYGPEWTTSDGSRPSTPWDVSGVPEDTWIQTPIRIELEGEPVVVRSDVINKLDASAPEVDLILALRGGTIGDDHYEIIDGQDREFDPGDRVALVLTVKDAEFEGPELIGTTFGEGWEFLGRYRIEDDIAVLEWGNETHELPLGELVDSFEEASQ
jgi:hypothetical protein